MPAPTAGPPGSPPRFIFCTLLSPECGQNLYNLQTRLPKGPPGNGVVLFSECTMMAGKTPADALPAHRKVAAEMVALGSKASSWLFYPGMGNSDIDFHYWSVLGFNNYAELGAATELYVNGGGWQKAMGILGPVSRCKPPTVFDAHLVRAGAGR
jgi:hypothetical protein